MTYQKLVESVPNFSTSDPEVIAAITRAIDQFVDTKVLHVDPDRDYNRTVITFVTTLDLIIEVSVAAITTALEQIDMQYHHGAHPRIGAVDVFPLIPLRQTTYQELIPYSHEIAEIIGNTMQVPVFLYRQSARVPTRHSLTEVRKRQYEGLAEKLKDPDWIPDFGPRRFVPKSGAVVIGVRNFLIAFNVNLGTTDVEIATAIARRIRTSGYIDSEGNRVPGQLHAIQAMGVRMRDKGDFTQVSTNILDFEHGSSMMDVYTACQQFTSIYNTTVTGSELVGLIPQQAINMLQQQYHLSSVEELIAKINLNDLYTFIPEEKILDILVDQYF